MDVSLFDTCIKHISKKYEVLLVEDLVFSERIKDSNRYATVMFDDGYKDNIEYAAPILAKYNCKASFYVVTHCIDSNVPTWTHILEHLFQYTKRQDIVLDFDFLPPGYRTRKLNTIGERIAYVSKVKPFLKTLPHSNRNFFLNRVIGTYSDVEIPRLMMNWKDLSELKSAGHYVGSHTVHHSMLGTMDNENEIRNELVQSGIRIKEKLGYFPMTISYPVGSFNERVKELARECGYKLGLAVKQDIFDPAKEDLFEIPRIELYNESWFKTRLRISNSLERFKRMIRYR